MDWKSVGSAVAKAAPVLGGVLGGPVGAVASAAGSLVASFLGVDPTPEAVEKAVSDPAVMVKLKEIEVRHQERLLDWQNRQLQAEMKLAEEVNETMRAEAKSEHWPQWSWRPYWGFISGTAFLVVCVLVCNLAYQAVLGGKPEAMAMIPQVISAMATLFAIPGAILGVASWHRGKKQREQKA